MIRVVSGDHPRTGHVILRMCIELCSVHSGIKTLFSPITWLNLRLSPPESDKVNR